VIPYWYIVIPAWCVSGTVIVITIRNLKHARKRHKEALRRLEAAQFEQRRQLERDLEFSRVQITNANAYYIAYIAGDDMARREHQRYVQQQAQARERAHKRLMDSMTKRQRSDYTQHGYFDVESNLGNLYRISRDGHVGNIVMPMGDRYNLRSDTRGTPFNGPHFCMHLYNGVDSFPDDDHQLAQALMIRTDEVAFRRIACNLS
jgi:hypothetical protein